MARSRLSRHFFIKDDNFMVNNKIQKTLQESRIWSGKAVKCPGFVTHRGDLTSLDEWRVTQVSPKLRIQTHGQRICNMGSASFCHGVVCINKT